VTFREDASQIRKGHGLKISLCAANMAVSFAQQELQLNAVSGLETGGDEYPDYMY